MFVCTCFRLEQIIPRCDFQARMKILRIFSMLLFSYITYMCVYMHIYIYLFLFRFVWIKNTQLLQRKDKKKMYLLMEDLHKLCFTSVTALKLYAQFLNESLLSTESFLFKIQDIWLFDSSRRSTMYILWK